MHFSLSIENTLELKNITEYLIDKTVIKKPQLCKVFVRKYVEKSFMATIVKKFMCHSKNKYWKYFETE